MSREPVDQRLKNIGYRRPEHTTQGAGSDFVLPHLGEVVEKMLEDHISYPKKHFEELSYLAMDRREVRRQKEEAFKTKKPEPSGESTQRSRANSEDEDDEPSEDLGMIRDDPQLTKEYVRNISQLMGFLPQDTEAEAEGEPAELPPIGYVPDLVADDCLFRKAGYGFGEKMSYILYSALKRFMTARNPPNIKFWGRITGTQRDYFIVEAEIDPENQEEVTEPHEPRKEEGVNKRIYFVTNDPLDPEGWIELPVLLPRHIIQARQIRHTFTGNLETPIHTSPIFQDVIPAGVYKITENEDDPNPQEIEKLEGDDLKPISIKKLTDLSNWVHLAPIILKEGRIKRKEIEEEDDEKKANIEKERLLADPYERRLKPLNQDVYANLKQCWMIRTHGDLQDKVHPYLPTTINNTVLSLGSLIWPGMVHILTPSLLIKSVYIGDGQKYTTQLYFHKFPYLIMSEPNEPTEDGGEVIGDEEAMYDSTTQEVNDQSLQRSATKTRKAQRRSDAGEDV